MKIRSLTPADAPLIKEWAESGALANVAWPRHNPGLVMEAGVIESGGSPVGGVTLFDVDPLHRSAEIAVYIVAEGAQNLGLGLRAVRKAMARGFDRYGLERIQAQVLARNKDVQDLLKRAGFVKEGARRKAALVNDEFLHVVMWSMLRDEFDRRWRR